MKRIWIISLFLLVMISLCACGRTTVDQTAEVTLTFIYEDENISVTLAAEEAGRIRDILNGCSYDSRFAGIPSCGFHENISLRIGNRVFAIARDTCNCIQDLDNLRYFHIPIEDMEYIRSLFEKNGGYFPCL
jgi:hypothetical protein